MLPFGLRFGALLLTPLRYWGWLLGAEFVALVITEAGFSSQPASAGALTIGIVDLLIGALGVLLIRGMHVRPSLRVPEDATRLLLSAMLLIVAMSSLHATIIAITHHGAFFSSMLYALGLGVLGHYLSILLIVPLMIMLIAAPPRRKAMAGLVTDGLLVMLPSMSILLALCQRADPQPQFARVLSLAPVLFFAFRHGWRGASLAMLITSSSIALGNALIPQPLPTAADYLFLAVAGTGALLLGSATDALRHSGERVAQQNQHLGAVNRRLDHLASQARDAARRNLQVQENQRRYMAAELHDELGQNITAIQTHVKLAQARLAQAGVDDVASSINDILGHMRRALRRLLDDLRPAVLDEFGLLRALDEGPVRDLLDAAGVRYHTQLSGDPRQLDEDTRIAVYRLVQESATNAVKHAQARHFRLRLRIGERGGATLALLDIRDDGVGFDESQPALGHGLQGMRDRVTSLGGVIRLRPGPSGVRLRVMLRVIRELPIPKN